MLTNSAHRLVFFLSIIGILSAGPSWAELSYEGSVPIGELIIREAAKHFELKTKIKFTSIFTHGTGEAFRAIRTGRAAIGGVARELTPEERAARVYSALIGYDTLGIFVNENNPVSDLTKTQIKNIFTGRTVTWAALGWTDTPIKVLYDQTQGRTVNITFRLTALGGQQLRGTPVNARAHLAQVSQDAHVITFDSLPFQTDKCKSVSIDGVAPMARNVRSGAYPLSRPLFLISPEVPTGERKLFFDFILSSEGQMIIARAGFLPAK